MHVPHESSLFPEFRLRQTGRASLLHIHNGDSNIPPSGRFSAALKDSPPPADGRLLYLSGILLPQIPGISPVWPPDLFLHTCCGNLPSESDNPFLSEILPPAVRRPCQDCGSHFLLFPNLHTPSVSCLLSPDTVSPVSAPLISYSVIYRSFSRIRSISSTNTSISATTSYSSGGIISPISSLDRVFASLSSR